MKLEYTGDSLNIEDYQACKKFYCEILGFEVVFANDKNQYAELVKGRILITIYNYQKFRDWIGTTTTESVSYNRDNTGIALKFGIYCA
ncbi:MAG: VOC family protein [Rivularia sp. (in: Bacteria)]|nr:VOC family protein [Rivularia sp. MS3]